MAHGAPRRPVQERRHRRARRGSRRGTRLDGKAPQDARPGEGHERGEEEAHAPRGSVDDSGEDGRGRRVGDGEGGLLEADRRAASGSTGQLGGRGERQAVPGERESPGDDERWEEQQERRADESGGGGESDREADREPAKWRDPREDPVRPATCPDAQCGADELHQREDAAGGRRREASLAVEEEDDEAEDARLGGDDKRAPDREAPHARVPERAPHGELLLARRSLPQTDGARQRGREAAAGQRDEPAAYAPGVGDRRKSER